MPEIKAVITDYVGTLTSARDYNMEASRTKLHQILTEADFETSLNEFLAAYNKAHEKYRLIRYGDLKEVTNAVWISEALNSLGFEINMEDPRLKTALNIFFQDYVDTLELRPYAKRLIRRIAENCKLGLVSNFTYAPVVYASLRKLDINQFFDAIVVSEDAGWRKPHKRIFQDALQRLQATAEETCYIGDSPLEDIKGAKAVGMRTIFVPSQFYSFEDMRGAPQQPDAIVEDLREIYENFDKLIASSGEQPTQSHGKR